MARTLTGNALWQELGWQPSPAQEQSLGDLQEQLRQWNSKLNLTRLVEDDDFWIAQVFDSLWPLVGRLNGPPSPLRCVDVGTGGGFPGLAVAIALPEARLTLIDSVDLASLTACSTLLTPAYPSAP
jgi:16S rRNA (guanine527-N7)-methyltransferase